METNALLKNGPQTPAGRPEDESIRRACAISRRKLALLDEMRYLSEKALGFVGEDDIDALENVVNAKQGLINEIDFLDEKFLIEYNDFKTAPGAGVTLPPVQTGDPGRIALSPLEELKGVTAEILDALQKINDADKLFNAAVGKLRENISFELTRIRKQKDISALYGNGGPGRRKREASDLNGKPSFDAKN